MMNFLYYCDFVQNKDILKIAFIKKTFKLKKGYKFIRKGFYAI